MTKGGKTIRQSVTLAPEVARHVRTMAKSGHTTASRVIAELIERGLEAKANEKQQFLDLAERLTKTRNRVEQKRIKEALARLTFGS